VEAEGQTFYLARRQFLVTRGRESHARIGVISGRAKLLPVETVTIQRKMSICSFGPSTVGGK
jgi:hypothetical protein